MLPVLTITLNPDGSIAVNGPIGNKMLCYGMLEAAKDAIRDYIEKDQTQIVVPAMALPKGN